MEYYKFPDNFKRFEGKWWEGYDFKKEAEDFKAILDKSRTETDIQRYIKENEKWFIPASILKNYDFGHHAAYLVPEQALGNQYRTDYMLVGKNSIGFQIVLVEFENANVEYLTKGTPRVESDCVRKGLAQIEDWEQWLSDNRGYFIRESGLQTVANDIPQWGFHYCLVVSRRDRMDEDAKKKRGGKIYKIPGLNIITYDRLVDNIPRLGLGIGGI